MAQECNGSRACGGKGSMQGQAPARKKSNNDQKQARTRRKGQDPSESSEHLRQGRGDN